MTFFAEKLQKIHFKLSNKELRKIIIKYKHKKI